MSCNQNVRQNHNIKMANKSCENMARFEYLGTNQNWIHKGIKRRLNLGNAYYHSVQKPLSSHPSQHLKITIYKTIILPTVLYECKTWFFTLRIKGAWDQGTWENICTKNEGRNGKFGESWTMSSFIICTFSNY
jgi:hypothetical protein